jgi:hypothetical protein
MYVCVGGCVGVGCGIAKGGLGDVLGLLFLADVELFLSALTLGEGVAGECVKLCDMRARYGGPLTRQRSLWPSRNLNQLRPQPSCGRRRRRNAERRRRARS